MVGFKLLGIDFSVSVGFMCVITFMMYVDKTGLMPPSLEAVLLHEVGHIAALKLMKTPPTAVSLKLGSITLVGRYVMTPKDEIKMLLMGPLANMTVAGIFYFCYKMFLAPQLLNRSLIMLVVGIFNLFPVIGLDGGDIIGIFLSKYLTFEKSRVCLKIISAICGAALLFLGGFTWYKNRGNPSLILLSIYLLICTFKTEK
jgi:Zn-dependent protease